MAPVNAATFSSKIRSLNEYYNNIVNCSIPVVNTGADIASILKYFSQTLLDILTEITQEENFDAALENDRPNASATKLAASAGEKTEEGGGGGDATKTQQQPHDLSNLAQSATSLGTIVSKTVYSLNDDVNDQRTYSSKAKKYPNLNFVTLYHSLLNIIEIIPNIQPSQIVVGQTLIQTLGCLAPFLSEDVVETLPYTIALTLTTFPRELHKCIMDTLCNSILPIAIYSQHLDDSFMLNSIPSIIMVVINYGNDTVYYSQLFEALLGLKRDFMSSVLCSIAYGTYRVRYHATNLLFRYWPKFNPNKSDRNTHYRFTQRKAIQCQSEKCVERKNPASKVCIDPHYSVHGSNSPPPYYFCNECYRDVPKKFQMFCHNIVQPVEDLISLYCENRNCKATDKLVHVVCYSSPCITLNQNKPITFCKECHTSKHQRLKDKADHVFQEFIDDIWKCDSKTRSYLTTTIVNLLREVPIIESRKNLEFMEHNVKKTTSQPAGHVALNHPTTSNTNPGNSLLNLQASTMALATTSSASSPIAPSSPQPSLTNNNTTGQSPQPQAPPLNNTPTLQHHASLVPNMATPKGDITSLIGVGLIGALNTNGFSNTGTLASSLFSTGSLIEESNFNKRLLSRFSCYLVYSLIKPTEAGDIETFGRIISMMLEWFHLVCYIPSDASGELISKIRAQYILPWIKTVIENHSELVISCLIPFPPDFTKIGGVWETKSNRSIQIKEEFVKFCDLIPYEIVSYDIWNYCMPYWLEAILNEVDEKHITEFKTIFVKLFDPDMMLFTPEQMYHFISERFEGTSASIQEQALAWLQLLCELDVSIPIPTLVGMFQTGLNSLQKLESRAMRRREALTSSTNSGSDVEQMYNQNVPNSNAFTVFDTYEAYRVYRNQLMLLQLTGQELAALIKEEEEDFIINNSELNITCCIMMLDMILKQFELHRHPQSIGIHNQQVKDVLLIMSKQLILPWAKKHKCKQQFGFLSAENASGNSGFSSSAGGTVPYCPFCEEYVLWFSFAKDVLTHVAPKQEIEFQEINFHHLLDQVIATSSGAGESAAAVADKVPATPKKSDAKTDPEVGIWVTSCGVYYFKFNQLQPHLQLLYSLLKELYRVPDIDAFFNLLQCLKMLILHCDCLELAYKEQKGFLIYCLEKLLVPNLWKLFSADYCHLNETGVSLLACSLIYESGRNTFWNLVNKDFKDPNWKIRMQAASKCMAIAQHLKLKQIKSNHNIFSSLSFAFSNMLLTIDDIEPLVAQKTLTLLETLSDQAIKSILTCFELQFDCVIADRLFLLKVINKLYSSMLAIGSKSQSTTLSWEFFMQRFNSISMETQLVSDILSPVDISGVNVNNNNTQRKINMARLALKRSDLIKPISVDLNYAYSLAGPPSKDSKSIDSKRTPTHRQSSKKTAEKKESSSSPEKKEEVKDDDDDDVDNKSPTRAAATAPPSPPTLPAHLDQTERNEIMIINDDVTLGNVSTDLASQSIDESKELENLNNEIQHSLVTLMMRFMVYDDQTAISEDRILTKQQNVVLKHMYSLLKYSMNDHLFTVAPSVLRKTTVVNAFLSGLAMVLDKNFALGNILLHTSLRLLRYLPWPSLDENISIKANQLQTENVPPAYTIGLLNSQTRHAWIQSLVVILYKYQYASISNDSNLNYPQLVKHLVQIVINTLKFQFHKCEINAFDPIRSNLNPSRYDNRDVISQKSETSTNLLSTLNNDDNLSYKSFTEKLNNRQSSSSVKKLLKINFKSKSSAGNLNQILTAKADKKRMNQLSKDIKVLSTSQLPIESKKKDNEYEAVLLDTSSSVYKFGRICPFNLGKLFKSPQSKQNIALQKVKTSKVIQSSSLVGRGSTGPLLGGLNTATGTGSLGTGLGVLGTGGGSTSGGTGGISEAAFFKHNSYTVLNQNYNARLSQQVNRKSAITKYSIDDLDSSVVYDPLNADDNFYLSKYEMIMNSYELFNGEYGLTYIKCFRCDARLEFYAEDSLGGLIVACSTVVHREPSLAAPFILDMIISVMRIAWKKQYAWQANSNFYLPCNYSSVAKQFLRCVLHQLVNNRIFFQLFQCDFENPEILEVLAVALNDFNELTSIAALKQIINDLNSEKAINMNVCISILNNVACYIKYLPMESQVSHWTAVIQELEILYHQIEPLLIRSCDYTCIFTIMNTLLKVPSITSNKTILEPFSRILSFILRNCTFKLESLIDICSLSNRAFAKDRDKQHLPRCIINELVQSIGVRLHCTDKNILLILQLAVLDAGGSIYKSTIIEEETEHYDPLYYIQTNAADCLKQHINEIISFIADIHSLTKIKQSLKLDKHLQTCPSEDSLGAQLKAGLAQFLSLEFTELNKFKDRDSRSIAKYLPWLSNLPPNAQQGAKEFVECIDHIRFLSWILIGSLTHSALTRNKGTVISYPIPINCGNYIGEHIFYILNGFADHSKTSAIHMSSLFHSFILCQLWTMYCEQIHVTYDNENDTTALNAIMEFWTKITPGILQLLSQTKVLADMVILHFLSLIEGLQEYNSLVLAKFFPMWVQVLFMSPLQGDQLKRAKQCLNYQPPTETQLNTSANYNILIKCLQRLQYKIAMIEMQSSNAAQLQNA